AGRLRLRGLGGLGLGRHVRRSRCDRLAGDLRHELRLELRRHLAPLVVATARRRSTRAGTTTATTRRAGTAVVGAVLSRPGGGRAPADVRIAVDPATAAAAIALARDGGLVGR